MTCISAAQKPRESGEEKTPTYRSSGQTDKNEGFQEILEHEMDKLATSETQVKNLIEEKACYMLELPMCAELLHSRIVDGDTRKYYLINDEDGERYVYTTEKDQEFNEMMKEAARRHKK